MTTQNSVNVGLSGTSGTGNFCGSNSPIIVTPTLGVAAATSINFGGSSLSTYKDSTSFAPTITFDTVGDLSVAYATQNGEYLQIGSIVIASISLTFTPTYTTASGNIRISLPLTIINQTNAIPVGTVSARTITYPVSCTNLSFRGVINTTYGNIYAIGSTVAATALSVTQFTSAVQRIIQGTIVYLSTN
jgi:hypothetical protein